VTDALRYCLASANYCSRVLFNNSSSIQTATSDLLRARLKATATPSSQVTDPSPANAPPGGATNWQEHCVAKDKELKDILLASSRARSLAGQVFNRMEELSSTKERQTGDVFASSEGNV
jgi:hypothetical protein